MLYRLLRVVATLGLRWYYRSIAVEGRDRVPARGPVILAANHNNALVDALLIATAIDREVRLTAKATLLDHPLTRVLVQAVGVVPLRRASDEARAGAATADASRNRGAFEAIVATLADDGVVLIFPEGISHSGPELAPLRTGCARMALQAGEAGVRDLHIIPVGLTFEAKGRPRSRVAITFGAPIPVGTVDAGADDAVATLTAAVERGLRAVTLNFPSHDDARRILELSESMARTVADVESLDAPHVALTETVRIARQLEVARRLLPDLPPETAQRMLAFVDDVERWRTEVRALPASPLDIGTPLSLGAGAWFLVREVVIATVAGPVALWGRLNHWVPLRLATALGRATARNPDEPAMHTLVVGLGLVLATYAAIAVALTATVGWGWALAYLAALPFAASLDFWWSDRVHAAMRRARGYLSLRAQPDAARRLTAERQRLKAEADRLTEVLDPAAGGAGSDPRGPSATHPRAPSSVGP